MKHYNEEPIIATEETEVHQNITNGPKDYFFLDPFGYLERHGVDLEGLRHDPSLPNLVATISPILPGKYQHDVRKLSGVLTLLDTGERNDIASDIAASFFEAYDAYKREKSK
jgi:hypothetical protein